MTTISSLLNKPEYLLQPMATLRRLFRIPRTSPGSRTVRLHWGLPLEVDTRETIGEAISRCGIYDISVTEAIFRLIEPGDNFLDIGANIGFTSSAAVAAGAKTMVAFEPHPDLFRQLQRNIALWTEADPEIGSCVTARQEAVSNKTGVAMLRIPKQGFLKNHGRSSLETGQHDDDYLEVEVPTTTLTQVLEQVNEPVGVLKIDIEDHELTAFTASREALVAGRIRDIIYEDHVGMNSSVSQLLADSGYSIFGLNRTPLGPVLLDEKTYSTWFFVPLIDNFLATRDPDRALRRIAGRGFRCLQNQDIRSARRSH